MKKYLFVICFLMLFFVSACNKETLDDNQYKIKSASMSPVIEVGAIVTIEEVGDGSQLEVGDYIMTNISVTLPDENTPTSIVGAMQIVEINETIVAGNSYYNFVISDMNGSTSRVISIHDIIGLIIDIDNP